MSQHSPSTPQPQCAPAAQHGNMPLSRSRPYRVALFGAFGGANFGNDATLDACLSIIREDVPAPATVCIVLSPERVAAKYGIQSFPISVPHGRGRLLRSLLWIPSQFLDILRAWRLLRHVRTFVVAGTGVLDDQHVTPFQLPLDVFRWSLAARLAGARLVFLSVGAGPIESALSRALLKGAVRFASQVSYRDSRSREYMRSLGRDVRSDRVLPDLVFARRPREPKQQADHSGNRRVAIGLLWKENWADRPQQYKRYEDRIVALIVRLASRGWSVHLLKGDGVDIDTQQAILARPEIALLSISPCNCRSFDDVVDVAFRSRAMIASRYHNVVAGVLAGIPVVSLAYGPKNLALLDQLGSPERNHDIDDFGVDDIVAQVELAADGDRTPSLALLADYQALLQLELEALSRG